MVQGIFRKVTINMVAKENARSVARKIGLGLKALGFTLPERIFEHLHRRGPFDVVLPNGNKVRRQSQNTSELCPKVGDGVIRRQFEVA